MPGDAHKEGTAGVCVCEEKEGVGGGAESQRSHPPSRCCTLKPNCVSVHLGACDKSKQQQTVFVSVSRVWNFEGLQARKKKTTK